MASSVEPTKNRKIVKRVGAFLGASYLDSTIDGFYGTGKWPASATWPLAVLTLDDATASLAIGTNKATVKYTDIQSITIKKLGFIHVQAKGDLSGFGFGLLNISKILREFEQRGVPAEKISDNNLLFASVVNYAQAVLGLIMLGLIVRELARTLLTST